MAEYMKTSFASSFFAVDMMFMSASSIKGKSTLLLREAARRFIFRSATVCGRSISRWLKAEKVRYAEKELSNKRRLLLKIYGFHKSLVIKLIHIEKMAHQHGYFLWCFIDWLCKPLS